MASGKGKTIKIRIAVAVDENGTWGACGWKGAKDSEVMDIARENAEGGGEGLYGAEQQYFVTVEVALPRLVELGAALVETGERINAEEAA